MKAERYSVQEAWDRFPELRDRFGSIIDEISGYRAVVLRRVVRPGVTECWPEGERGFLDSPEYDGGHEYVVFCGAAGRNPCAAAGNEGILIAGAVFRPVGAAAAPAACEKLFFKEGFLWN